MIYVFYTKCSYKLKKISFDLLLNQLPINLQNKILKFRDWRDAQRSLIGKVILIKALKLMDLTRYTLDNLKFTEFQRIYFDANLDFNISHSEEYIICAISETNKVGIDIEKIKGLQIYDFENQFSNKEWEEILDDNSLKAFYSYWTKKEAFLKAIGTGLKFPLKNINIIDNKILWHEKPWYLSEIKINREYVSHLATDKSNAEVVIQTVQVI